MNYLSDKGVLDADRILYTAPGLHESAGELEEQLTRQLGHAGKYSQKIIVIYGSRCYVDPLAPSRSTDQLIREHGEGIRRIQTANCFDMLADAEGRERISQGEKIYSLSPGWLIYWKQIFKKWDIALANETFPKHNKAFVLDAL